MVALSGAALAQAKGGGGHVEDEFLGITFTGGAGGSDKGGGSGSRF